MADNDQENVVTMMDVLQEQEAFEEDANAVLGASDDKNCTYSKGYVKRQAIYACLTCSPGAKTDKTKRAGVCLACSLHCHENHELIELYTKRLFCCDCGNPNFNGHPCKFTPEKSDLNWDNKYNQNFAGLYCVCQRPYPDPEAVEEEEMLQCIVCEDWLHCKHLEATVPDNDAYAEMICKDCMEDNDFLHDYSELVVNVTDKEVEVYDPDLDISNLMEAFKKDKLPNGDAKEAEADKEKPAEQDTAEIKADEPTTNGEEKPETEPTSTENVTPEKAEVKTTDNIVENTEEKDKPTEVKDPEEKPETTAEKVNEEKPEETKTDKSIAEETKADESIAEETKADESSTEETKTGESTTAETKATTEEKVTENAAENQPSENKRKLSKEDSEETTAKKKKTEAVEEKKCVRPRGVKKCYNGATFWPANFRQKLCTCGECIEMYKDLGSLFLIDIEDTVTAYEALGKERVDGPSSQYEKGLQALSTLDRVQQINAITEYNNMRDKLVDFLQSFKDRKEVVKEEDIKGFFAGIKAKREPDGVYFCR